MAEKAFSNPKRMEACGDTPRVILGCPLAGIDADEVIDATPEIHEINERYIGSPEFSNLPRKFKSALSGCTARSSRPQSPGAAESPTRAEASLMKGALQKTVKCMLGL